MIEHDNEKFKENSQAVQSHLTILQNVIQRMSGNSNSCKAWCVTLVSAILVVVVDKNKGCYASIALIPTFLFLFLDAYYLSLEIGFRNSYNSFIKNLHHGGIKSIELFKIEPHGDKLKLFFEALSSFSVWPFYMSLLITILLSKKLL